MLIKFFRKYNRAFFEILFLRFWSEDIRSFNPFVKFVLFATTAALFYIPILYFMIRSSIEKPDLISYYITVTILHIFAKFMLNNSKRIQARFSAIRNRKSLIMRTWLVIEYVVFMWLVYLTYPIACILMPLSLIIMCIESLLGVSALAPFFFNYPEQFILWGGIVAYFLFILADGYKKLRTGFLPDYLGLYAVLTIVSASMERWVTMMLNSLPLQLSNNRVLFTFSQVFRLSNDAMNIVASSVTFLFAVFSLYTTCGQNQGVLADPVVTLEKAGDKKTRKEKHPRKWFLHDDDTMDSHENNNRTNGDFAQDNHDNNAGLEGAHTPDDDNDYTGNRDIDDDGSND